jgi:hypothetical protein
MPAEASSVRSNGAVRRVLSLLVRHTVDPLLDVAGLKKEPYPPDRLKFIIPTNPPRPDLDFIMITTEQAQEVETFAKGYYLLLDDAIKQREGVGTKRTDEAPTDKYSIDQLHKLRDDAELAQLFFAQLSATDRQGDHESVREPQRRLGNTGKSLRTHGLGSRGRLASKYGRRIIHARVIHA